MESVERCTEVLYPRLDGSVASMTSFLSIGGGGAGEVEEGEGGGSAATMSGGGGMFGSGGGGGGGGGGGMSVAVEGEDETQDHKLVSKSLLSKIKRSGEGW